MLGAILQHHRCAVKYENELFRGRKVSIKTPRVSSFEFQNFIKVYLKHIKYGIIIS